MNRKFEKLGIREECLNHTIVEAIDFFLESPELAEISGYPPDLLCDLHICGRHHGILEVQNQGLQLVESALGLRVSNFNLGPQRSPDVVYLLQLGNDHHWLMIVLVILRALRTVIFLSCAIRTLGFLLETHVENLKTSVAVAFGHFLELK